MKQGLRVMDSDIHVFEPLSLWTEYLEPRFRDRAPTAPGRGPIVWEVEGKAIPAFLDQPEKQRAWRVRMRRALSGGPAADALKAALERRAGGTQPQDMLQAMDTEGVDVSIVFRTLAGHITTIDDMEPAFAAALCRAFNRWLRDFCKTDAQRLKLAAIVPLHDPVLAIEEARFAVRELGAVALVLPSQPIKGRTLYDRDYDPFWAAAQQMDVAIAFHGIHVGYSDHLARRYLDNLVLGHAVGQPVELMLALGSVLTGGVLSRFPRLRMAFLEGNCSWLPWWLWALDERWEKWGDRDHFQQQEKPSELFARQCFISIDPAEPFASHVVAELGDDNLVLSTDWPHDDSSYPHAVDNFLAQTKLSAETKRKVLWDNCARLYGVD